MRGISMKYKGLVLQIVQLVLEEYLEQEKKKEKENVVKTSNVPTAPTPTERANALKRKEANKYTSYIANKLLPGLDK